MNAAVRGLVLTGIALGGCHAAHDVAVTSYRVATAPVHFVHRQLDKPDKPSTTETTTTTTTTTSAATDVSTPGQPASPPVSASTKRRVVSQREALPTATPQVTHRVNAEAKPKPSPGAASTQLEFPTAKPVAGKPGYVHSPSDPGKYVDVSGYAPGSKVKDPYSGKIFLVP